MSSGIKLEEAAATVEATEIDNETLNQLNATFLANVSKMVSDVKFQVEADAPDFNYQLIQEVKKRPCLYNMNDDTYNNNQMRAAMWGEIAAKFHTSPEFVKTRWKTMRDRYKKEEKRAKLGRQTSWTFFNELHFISPYLRPRYPHDPEERLGDGPVSDDEGSPQPPLSLDSLFSIEDKPELISRKRAKHDDECLRTRMEPSVPSPLSINTASSPSNTPMSSSSAEKGGQLLPSCSSSNSSTSSNSETMTTSQTPQLAPPTWNRLQDEEAEIFGHMIAMKIAKLPPKLREKAKICLWSTLYDVEFGNE